MAVPRPRRVGGWTYHMGPRSTPRAICSYPTAATFGWKKSRRRRRRRDHGGNRWIVSADRDGGRRRRRSVHRRHRSRTGGGGPSQWWPPDQLRQRAVGPIRRGGRRQRRLFIADTQNNRVVEDPAGGGPQITVGSGFGYPTELAVDAKGDLFIVETATTGWWRSQPAAAPRPPSSAGWAAREAWRSTPKAICSSPMAATWWRSQQVAAPRQPWLVGWPARVLSGLRPSAKVHRPQPTRQRQGRDRYSYTFKATSQSGEPQATFALSGGGLPPGITLNKKTGVLSGTPTTPGTYTFVVEAENVAEGVLSPKKTITVAPARAVTRRLR